MLIVGVAYKPNVDDMRESPAAEIIETILDLGAEVDYTDPLVPVFPQMRRHQFKLHSVDLDPAVIASYDCIVIVTDHDALDYEQLRENAQLIIDARGRYRDGGPNIIRA